MRRIFVLKVFILVIIVLNAAMVGGMSNGVQGPPVTNSFKPLQIGGGGWVVGADLSITGVRFLRTDTAFGYLWGTSDNKWHNLVTRKSMPFNLFGYYPRSGESQIFQGASGGGVLEVCGAPNDANTAYLFYAGHVLVSSNINPKDPESLKWIDTGFPAVTDTSNGTFRMDGRKMAVDPNNKDHVIVGTMSSGLWETTDGTHAGGATWTRISSASIPLAISSTNYNVAFDPASGVTSNGRTKIVYVFTSGSPAGVYTTLDGGASWTITKDGPSIGMSHMVVSETGGVLWAVDNPSLRSGSGSGTLWKFVNGSWTKVLNASGNNYHSVAVNPKNVSHVVALGNDGAISVSTDGGATFVPYRFSRGLGDAPWQAWYNQGYLAAGDIFFDPLQTDVLIFTGGQGVWTTVLPKSDFTWSPIVSGIEQAIAFSVEVPAANKPTIGHQDVASFTFHTLDNNSNQSAGNPIIASKSLMFTSGIAFPPNDPDFMVQKISANFDGGSDYSGYSTDQFISNYFPFSRWNARVPALTSVSNNGASRIRVTVPSTSDLTTWVNGHGSIVCSVSTITVPGGNALSGRVPPCFAATVIDSTHFDLQNSTWLNSLAKTGGDYIFYVPPSTLLTAWNGALNVIGTDNLRGKIQISYMFNNFGLLGNGVPICISGISSGTIEANGCWISEGADPASRTVVLGPTSSFINRYDPAGGGVMATWGPPGGSIAAADRNNIVTIAENNSYPLCSTDGGRSWRQLAHSSIPVAATVVTGGPYIEGTRTIQVIDGARISGGLSTTLQIPMDDGRFYYSNVITKAGTMLTLTVPVPAGHSIANGASVYIGTGWGFAAFLNQRSVVADTVAPNTFFAVNSDAGLFKWRNCSSLIRVNRANAKASGPNWLAGGGFNSTLKSVPGESGHLFYTAGPQGAFGAAHPANTGLWRSCNGDNDTALDMIRVNGFFEVVAFGFGAPAIGRSYPSEYVVGWYDPRNVKQNAIYGIWRSIDDPNHGNSGGAASCKIGPNWTRLDDWPMGWMAPPHDISGDPSIYGEVYITTGAGSFYGMFNFLQKRDLDPTSNDSSPMFLNKAA